MKQIQLKSLLLLFLAFLMPATATAYEIEIEVDGIKYLLHTNNYHASVYRLVNRSYTGSIIIPDSVIWQDKTYTVTDISGNAR